MSHIIKKQEEDYNMIDWWKKVVFDNYANFYGRARRSEYWYFTLFNIILAVPLVILFVALAEAGGGSEFTVGLLSIFVFIIALAMLLPSVAVAVRRLHDTGKSGWWYIIGVIPLVSYVGSIVLLVFYCTDSDPGSNKWGPNPKLGAANEIDEIGKE